MYYLKSRGIDKQIAEKLIVQGFLKSVFEDKELDKRDYKKLTYQIANVASFSQVKAYSGSKKGCKIIVLKYVMMII